MRLTALIIMAACLQVSARSYSQKVSLKLENVRLRSAFEKIKQQTGYSFLLDQDLLNKTPRISIDIRNADIETALNACLNGVSLTYSIQGKIIYIKPKQVVAASPDAMLTMVVQREIHGRVTDSAGNPITGATVIVKSTKKGTFTNARGEYNIAAATGDVLQFSFVGYNTKEVSVSQNSELNITLTAKSSSLNEIVIVGYGTQRKADVTGAVSTIKMDDVLGNRPVSTLPALLQNISPGLQVSISSGQPGASSSFNIRGGTDFGSAANSTINTGGPFILVDNVPFNGGLNLLDPNDIESVTVLKDAGSAAIYGARSAFGVILITTKKGRYNQKTQLTYDDNFTTVTPMNLPQKVTPLQQVQALMDGGRTTYYTGQVLTVWDSLLQSYQKNPALYPGGYSMQGATYYQLAPTNALKQLLGNSAFQNTHNLSVSGGSEKSTYRISGGYTNENGVLVPSAHQDNYKRYNFMSDVSTNVNSWWNVQLNMGYNNSTLTRPYQQGNAFTFAAWLPAFDALDSIPGINGLIQSPANEIKYTAPDVTNQGEFRATARTVFTIMKGLQVTGEYAIDNTRSLETSYDQIPQITLLGATTYVPQAIGTGTFSKTTASTNYSNLNIYGNYNTHFGNHNLTVMMGFNQEQSNYEQEILSRTSPINSTLPSISTSTGPTTGTDNYDQYANRGAFGRINYDFKNKYLFQVNGRYDGSSKFPPGHQ